MEDTLKRESYHRSVPSVEQAAKIILFLSSVPGGKAKLKDICNALGMHRSKAYSILSTLQKFGFVFKDRHFKLYRLGPGLIHLGRKAEEVLDLSEVSLPHLKKLSDETLATSFLGLLSGRYIFVVEKCDGPSPLGITIEKGKRFPVLMGAHGKVILAFFPDEERKKLMKSEKLYLHGSPENFDPERLKKEISEARRLGYAVDPGDLHPGIKAVSSPVFNRFGGVLGVVVAVGTFGEEEFFEIGSRVREAAGTISKLLGYE